jgi:uncharacterized lipoprotein YmbA
MKSAPSIRLVAAVGVLLLLATGCVNLGPGTASPTRLYVLVPLGSGETGVVPNRLEAVSLGVGPLAFPEYLDRPQIVTRVGESEIRTADFANWAEPLQRNFLRVMTENLARLLGTDAVYAYPWRSSLRPAYRLEVAVVRFDADPPGEAVLAVDWEIIDGSGRQVRPRRKAVFRQPVGASDHAAVVAALSRCLADFSREVADGLAALN